MLFSALRLSHSSTLDDYNVVWTAPSTNSSASMPCGGGDIGLNVWVEKGDLLVYLSRSGAFDELNGFPKLGRLRVTLSPNPLGEGCVFRQELQLRDSQVRIVGEKDGVKATVVIWVDVFRPIAHIEVESSNPVSLLAAYENWRLADRVLSRRRPMPAGLGAMLRPTPWSGPIKWVFEAVRSVSFTGIKPRRHSTSW